MNVFHKEHIHIKPGSAVLHPGTPAPRCLSLLVG
ncbi:hypothetical protein GGD63_003439 [Bradyrhizobium sp. cir1]|nr:hypothetical protein [Bradyrhizobium sp. cir1]